MAWVHWKQLPATHRHPHSSCALAPPFASSLCRALGTVLQVAVPPLLVAYLGGLAPLPEERRLDALPGDVGSGGFLVGRCWLKHCLAGVGHAYVVLRSWRCLALCLALCLAALNRVSNPRCLPCARSGAVPRARGVQRVAGGAAAQPQPRGAAGGGRGAAGTCQGALVVVVAVVVVAAPQPARSGLGSSGWAPVGKQQRRCCWSWPKACWDGALR